MQALALVVGGAVALASLRGQRDASPALERLRRQVADLVRVAKAAYPGLTRAVRRVEEFPRDDMVDPVRRTVRRGKYDRNTGTVYVATTSQTGVPLPRAVIAGIIAHELGHAASVGNHLDEWRNAYLAMLDLATRVLGWKVMLECSSCGMYKVCTPEQCPACDWKVCAPKPPVATAATSTGPTSAGPTSTGPTSTGPTSTGPTSAGPKWTG